MKTMGDLTPEQQKTSIEKIMQLALNIQETVALSEVNLTEAYLTHKIALEFVKIELETRCPIDEVKSSYEGWDKFANQLAESEFKRRLNEA